MSKIVFQVIAIVFEGVKRFVLNFPAGSTCFSQTGRCLSSDFNIGDKSALVAVVSIPIRHFNTYPVNQERVFIPIERDVVYKAQSSDLSSIFTAFFLELHCFHLNTRNEIVERLVGVLLTDENKIQILTQDHFTERLSGIKVIAQ